MKTTRKRLARPSLRSVLATRHGALAVTLACAVITATIVVIAIGQYKHSPAPATPQATVLEATGTIPKGTSAQVIAAEHLYKEVPVLATQVSPATVVNAASLIGTVAASDILPGQQLTTSDFTVAHGVQLQLLPTQRAIAVTLDAAHGLSGSLQSGDHVDVYGSFTDKGTPVVGLLVPDATVLATTSGTAASGGGGGGTTLLAVGENVAPELAYASDNGRLWFVLRPTSTSDPSAAMTTLNSIVGTRP